MIEIVGYMIDKICIKNFKSIENLEMELGRANVFIGANGSGKSNILEAVAMVASRNGNNVELESMAQHGIRIAMPDLMVNSFYGKTSPKSITVKLLNGDGFGKYTMKRFSDDSIYAPWTVDAEISVSKKLKNEDFEGQYSRYVIYSP